MRLNAKVPDVNTTIIIKQKRHTPRAGRSEPGTGSMTVVSIMLLFFANELDHQEVKLCLSQWFPAFVDHVPWLLEARRPARTSPAKSSRSQMLARNSVHYQCSSVKLQPQMTLTTMRCETDKRFGRFETAFQNVSLPKTFQ